MTPGGGSEDKDMRKVKSQEGSAAGAQPVESPGTSPGASLGESPGESPGRSQGATKNEKRRHTKKENEILEPEMPETLKIDFLEEKLI